MVSTVMLFLIAFTSLSDMEEIPGEWIAPGRGISKETLVVFSDIGEMFQSETGSYVGAHVTFLEVNGVELWRAVVVYADQVILFQEDQDPVVTYYDFPVEYVSFSSSGNYVGFYRKIDPEENGGREGLRINVETGDIRYFDSQPNGINPFMDVVWNDGSITFTRDAGYNYSNLYFYDNELSLAKSLEVRALRIPGLSENFFISPSEILTCFTSSGIVLWENSINGRASTVPSITISDDGQFFLMPFSESESNTRLCLRSGENGNCIFDYSLPFTTVVCDLPVFLPDNSGWLCSARQFDQGCEDIRNVIISGDVESSTTSFSPFPVPHTYFRLVDASDARMLIWQRPGHGIEKSRYILTDQDYQPLYATPQDYQRGQQIGIQSSLTSQEISPNSQFTKLIYADQYGINLVELVSNCES